VGSGLGLSLGSGEVDGDGSADVDGLGDADVDGSGLVDGLGSAETDGDGLVSSALAGAPKPTTTAVEAAAKVMPAVSRRRPFRFVPTQLISRFEVVPVPGTSP